MDLKPGSLVPVESEGRHLTLLFGVHLVLNFGLHILGDRDNALNDVVRTEVYALFLVDVVLVLRLGLIGLRELPSVGPLLLFFFL